MTIRISHSPRECRTALAGASRPITIDLETSGKERSSRVVSVGVLTGAVAFILFIRSVHSRVRNISPDQLRFALGPLCNPGLTTVFHNASFDLGHLHREGIAVAGTVHDTMQMLRLLDQDRGGDGADVKTRRLDLAAPPGARIFTDYKLKNCVPMLTGVEMIDYPGRMAELPYREHVRYLSSDLIGTRALHEHLLARLIRRPRLLRYHDLICAPLTPVLVAMTEHGVVADVPFIRSERERLGRLAGELAGRHLAAFGSAIGDNAEVARWLWGILRLRPLPGKFKRQGHRWVPSLDADHLDGLRERHAADPRVAGSLALIVDHRLAVSMASKLGGLLRRAEGDGRIRSSLVDRQATGRISSSKPNLQQVPKAIGIAGLKPDFRPRNALVASPGHELVAMDLAQADIRVIADAVARFPRSASAHLARLRKRRVDRLSLADPLFGALHATFRAHRNPQYRPGPRVKAPPAFDPKRGSGLARAFLDGSADFYTVAATAMLGEPPAGKKERNFCKQTILGIVNGMGPKGLSKRLGCDEATARDYLGKFAAAYPNEMAFRRLMVGQIALTGRVSTFLGRDRTDTAHRWLVSRPRLEIKVGYKGGESYWMDITPLEPRARVLCCYVHRAWDARPGRREGRLIYDATHGIQSQDNYRLFDQTFLEFNLPVRNFGWRSIRRVRWRAEEAKYRGLDATSRALFNAIAQGGTADLTKLMMLGIGPTLSRFESSLLLQIHDELVFSVPRDRVAEFIRRVVPELSRPPVPGFAVPIVLEPKHGARFGAMEWRDARAITSLRPPRCPVARPGRRPVPPGWPVGCQI